MLLLSILLFLVLLYVMEVVVGSSTAVYHPETGEDGTSFEANRLSKREFFTQLLPIFLLCLVGIYLLCLFFAH
jgi:hypothetical protein